MSGARVAGTVFLILSILSFFATAAFTYTANPIVIMFPIAGLIFLVISIVCYIIGAKSD